MNPKYKVGQRCKLLVPYDMIGLEGTIIEVDTSGESVKGKPYYRLKLDKPYISGQHSFQDCGRSETEITCEFSNLC